MNHQISRLLAISTALASFALQQVSASTLPTTGSFTAEKWTGISAVTSKVSDLYNTDHFHEAPDATELTATNSYQNFSNLTGVRLRGTLVAPTTGEYYFWISSRDSSELWLSTDSTKYRKQRIARIDPDAGTNIGIPKNSPNLWDQYSAQISEPIQLVAGQSYFIEVVHKSDQSVNQHISLAWATPGAGRVPLDMSAINSYVFEIHDIDDDYLPDVWENQHGLNPSDNGLVDRAREGERGDFDYDGLSNREEYILGTNPNDPDTDGDGLTDSEEAHSYGTDPTQSDAPSQSLSSTIDITSFHSSSSPWIQTTTEGLVPETYRGQISWDFSVPSNGHWIVHLDTNLTGDIYSNEVVEVEPFIDGQSLGRQNLVFGSGSNALLRVITPLLTAGNHTFKLMIHNMLGRRSVSIQSLEILQPTGADLDSDGHPDWVIAQLTPSNTLSTYVNTSRTSPAFLEGYARVSAQVNSTPVETGTDQDHWFFDLPLNSSGATSFTVDFESGLSDSGSITWAATNALDGESLIIRKGDSLKLTGVPTGGPTGQDVSFVIPTTGNVTQNGLAVATQSSTINGGVAPRAIDGDRNRNYVGNSITHTDNEVGAWWQVDLGSDYRMDQIVIYNRGDNLAYRLTNYQIKILDSQGATVVSQSFHTSGTNTGFSETWNLATAATGRTVRIERLGPDRDGNNYLSLAEVEIFGDQIFTLADDSQFLTHQFTMPGNQQINVTHGSGATATLNVDVKQADFSTTQDIAAVAGSDVEGSLSFNDDEVDSSLFFDTGKSVVIDQTVLQNGNVFTLRALARRTGPTNLLARLHEGGPVVGVQPLNMIGVADVLQADLHASYLDPNQPGFAIITTPVIVTDLPPGGYLRVFIYRDSTSFLDGTKEKIFTAADFTDGLLNLTFLYDMNIEGGFCHHLDIYDRNGKFIARR